MTPSPRSDARQLKEWRRAWKVELIQKTNPQWDDLFEQIWSEIQGQGH